MLKAISFTVVLLALGACMPDGTSRTTAEPGTVEFLEQQRKNCEARGGSFGASPGNATKVCFITPKDANEACNQASDCEGHCLARSRTCSPVSPMFGCHEVLLSGGRPATICLD